MSYSPVLGSIVPPCQIRYPAWALSLNNIKQKIARIPANQPDDALPQTALEPDEEMKPLLKRSLEYKLFIGMKW